MITEEKQYGPSVKNMKLIAVILCLNTARVCSFALENSSKEGFAPVLLHFIKAFKQGDFQVSAAENAALEAHIKSTHIICTPTFHALQSPFSVVC